MGVFDYGLVDIRMGGGVDGGFLQQSIQTGSGSQPTTYPWVPGSVFLEIGGQGVDMVTPT